MVDETRAGDAVRSGALAAVASSPRSSRDEDVVIDLQALDLVADISAWETLQKSRKGAQMPTKKAVPKTPAEEAQAAVDKTAKGWKVDHAVSASTVTTTTPQGVLTSTKPGEFPAWARRDGQLIEATGDGVDQLCFRIEDWERSQPQEPAEPTEEQIANTVAATHTMSRTADSRKT